jgi:hypothetical protein
LFAAWHVVFARRGRERRAASDVCCLPDVDAFCPSVLARWFVRGRAIERALPLIAGVLFARWDTDDPALWHSVHDIDDVTGILGGWPPARVAEVGTFRLWLESADDAWVVPGLALQLAYLKRGYWVGSDVVVNHRALRGVLGTVEHIDEDRMMARVRYDLIGRPQRLFCPLAALSAVDAALEAVG